MSNILSLNPSELVQGHKQINIVKDNCSLTLQANFLVEDIVCKKSLFCSEIRGEKRKEERGFVSQRA